MVYRTFDEIIEKLKGNTQISRVAVAAANDDHTLGAVKRAADEGLVQPVLVGNKAQIEKVCEEVGLVVPDADIYDFPDDMDAANKAVALIHEGNAQFLMKGKLDTSVYLKAVVNKETGLKKNKVLSVFSSFECPDAYHKLIVPVDGGMVPYPTLEQKAAIIQNTVDALLSLGYDCPKVGVIACKEKVDPKMPETLDAAELKEMNKRGEITNCIVEGPISFDIATDKEIADFKGFDSPCAGDCDILLAPNIHAGNFLGKMLTGFCHAKMGGFVAGTTVPVVFTSRGSSSEEKYLSICLSAVASMNSK